LDISTLWQAYWPILSGIDGILDIIVFFFSSLYDVLGASVLIDVEDMSSAERLISDGYLIAEFVLGPFYITVGHGLLRLSRKES